MCCLTLKFLRKIIFGLIVKKFLNFIKYNINREGVRKMKLYRIRDELVTDWGDKVVDR